MSNRIDVSVILVNYKTPDLTYKCIRSLVEHTSGISYEIIVVDNDSQDGAQEKILADFKDVRWFQTGYNAGFARANNLGMKNALGYYALLLNSDTYLKDNLLKNLFTFYRAKEELLNLGLLAARYVDEEGRLLVGSHQHFPGIGKILTENGLYIWFEKLLGRDHRALNREKRNEIEALHRSNHQVAIVSGGCAFFNLNKLKKHSLYLDEDFFLYSEDVVWSHSFLKAGFRNYFCGEIEVIHKNAASAEMLEHKNFQVIVSSWLYIYKVFGAWYYVSYMLLLRFNLLIDDLFYAKAQRANALTETDRIHNEIRTGLKKVWAKYFYYILSNFSRKASASKEYLKFEYDFEKN